jgi:predicted NBD/HSP70 family sugar kinase
MTELLRIHGPLARTEIAERLGLNRSTVTSIVADLIDDGIVHELDTTPAGARARGRPRVLVGCNPDAASVLGVQIGARNARVVLADATGHVVNQTITDVTGVTPRTVVDRVGRSVDDLLAGRAGASIAAVGTCLPASVDTTTGTVVRSETLGWEDVPIADMLSERLQAIAYAQDVTQAATLAEALYGAAAGVANAIVLDHGGRIGVGLILRGELYRGSSGLAGSVGHTPVFGETTACRCGRTGCLEAVATSHAMTTAVADDDPASFAVVVEGAQRGDPQIRAAIARALDHTAHFMTTLVGVLDPDVVVLTGLVDRYPNATAYLQQRIVALTADRTPGRPSVRTSPLGAEAWVKGAVLVALQQLQPHVKDIFATPELARTH